MVEDDPSRIQAFGLPTLKVPFRSGRRKLVKTGARDVSWASTHDGPGARRPSEPCVEKCFPRSEGRKEEKEPFRYRFVTMPSHTLGRFPSVRASRDRTPQQGNSRAYNHQE